MLTDTEIEKIISSRMGDPCPQNEDYKIWIYFLNNILPISECLYQTFRGLRVCGAWFEIKDDKLDFHFPLEFDDELKNLVRTKYINPYGVYLKKAVAKTKYEYQNEDRTFTKRINI